MMKLSERLLGVTGMRRQLVCCLKILVAVLFASCNAPSLAYSNKFTAAADVFFEFQSADLNLLGRTTLEEFEAAVNSKNFEVLIAVGHSSKGEKNSQLLSERRAIAVKLYFMQLGIPPSQIYTEGKANSQPHGGNDLSKDRRAEIEFVGTYTQAKADAYGFNFLHLWDANAGRLSQGMPSDPWSTLTPLQFLPHVTDKRLRSNFLRKLQLVAIRNKDDNFLRAVWTLPGGDLVNPKEVISPALYASVFGTGYARQLLNVELAKLPVDDPTRLKFARRIWCDSPGAGSLIETIETVFPASTAIAKMPPNEQFEWLTCAATRGAELDVLWLRKLGLNIDATNAHGATALHEAVLRHNTNALRALIAAGANPNMRDASGAVPLHRVAQSHIGPMTPSTPPMRRILWDMLVQAGADIAIQDAQGKAAVEPVSR